VNYLDFAGRWLNTGGAERANYSLFLQDLCDLLAVPRPEPTTDSPAHDAYVLERAVTFDDGGGRQSTGRIDLYKRGCFVLETKQGVSRLEEVSGDYKKRTARDLTERNGTERNGTERNGTERNGTERNGTERNGVNWA
jgi:hypothetical protein